jgi:TonB family protein
MIPFNSPSAAAKNNLPVQSGESSTSSSEAKSGADLVPAPISTISTIHANSSTANAGGESSGLPPAPSPSNAENSSSRAIANTRAPVPLPPAPARAASANDGAFHAGALLHRVEPIYPADALAQGIEGIVKLSAIVDLDGTVKTVQALSGPSTLFPAAINAVSQWRYSPTFIEGRPIETERQITITFQLSPAKSN